jgi:FAD:protein FMN transferase
MTSLSNSVRRARPMLGTIVEIRADAPLCAMTAAGIESGFAAIARVERLMSVHASDSELSLLNRHACERAMTVDPWTYAVLTGAQRFWQASGGLFDCTIAPILARHGFLPAEIAREDTLPATQADVLLLDDGRVRFRRPLKLDLGGIAKGFAVDRAVEALQRNGIDSGAVNGGGDLRVFGPRAEPIHLRDPVDPTALILAGWLHDGAIASSASYFARRRSSEAWVGPIVDPRSGAPRPANDESISVIARDALTADALTKPVTLCGTAAADLLAQFGARALRFDADNSLCEIGHAA